jgi:chromosome segregation ATPase
MEKYCTEERIDTASEQELYEMKLWIFKESQRLEQEQKMVDSKIKAIEDEIANFRQNLQQERSALEHEKQRLKDDKVLFDQQIEILKDGFDKLNTDKKRLEKEWKKLEQEKGYIREDEFSRAEVFFFGVNSLISLKKRYKDLMKIYHPDNLCGDHEMCDLINQEYNILLRQFDTYMNA